MAGRRSIGSSVMFLIISSTAIVALSFLVIWFFIQAFSFQRSIEAKTAIVADRLAKTLALPLWSFDSDQMDAIARSELADPDFGAIDIVDNGGKSIFSADSAGVRTERVFGAEKWAKVGREIVYRGVGLGKVTITATGEATARQFFLGLVSQAILIFLVGSVMSLILYFSIDRKVSSRIAVLRGEIGSFSAPDLDRRASDRGEDEIGELASTFNAMAETIESYGRDLEGLVATRTGELVEAKTHMENRLVELRRTQDQLIESAKFAEIGRILAQIVHDLNSPLAAIRATVDHFESSGLARIDALPSLSAGLLPREVDLVARMVSAAAKPLPEEDFRRRRARRALVEGIVAEAGRADEDGGLAEPIFELGLERDREGLALLLRESRAASLVKMVDTIASGHLASATIDAAAKRASYVLGSLRNYLHSERVAEIRSSFALDAEIDGILALFAHRFRGGIELELDLQKGCEISGFRDQLGQVWMNLVDNAIQAMGGSGTLSIGLRKEDLRVVVEIGDSGPGIPEEIGAVMFEPFFTTKKKGQGTGLGLA
ncbi:MAG TPA: ATP-binding protein, partial [Rectinemataceae bacterium]|nr:ATP-binding protein [Rectinemataceae bacterium]